MTSVSLSASFWGGLIRFASRRADIIEISGMSRRVARPLTNMGFLIWASGKLSQSSSLETQIKQPINWPQPVMQKYIDAAHVNWQITHLNNSLSFFKSFLDSMPSFISSIIFNIFCKWLSFGACWNEECAHIVLGGVVTWG